MVCMRGHENICKQNLIFSISSVQEISAKNPKVNMIKPEARLIHSIRFWVI